MSIVVQAKLVGELDMAELLELRNRLASRRLVRRERDPLPGWRGDREALIAEIERLRCREEREPLAMKKFARRKRTTMAHSGVGRYVIKQLAIVIATNDDGFPVGLSYAAVLARTRRKFPESVVDEHHVRWYAAKARRENILIPVYRKRSYWSEIH